MRKVVLFEISVENYAYNEGDVFTAHVRLKRIDDEMAVLKYLSVKKSR